MVEFGAQQFYMALLLALSTFLMGVKVGMFISWLFSQAEKKQRGDK